MSCQIRKWRAAGAAAAAVAAGRTAETPAKKEMDSRLTELLSARAAQDQWMYGTTTTCTSAERSHQSVGPSFSETDPRVLSSQQTAVRNLEYGKAGLLR